MPRRHEVDEDTFRKWAMSHEVEFAACCGGGSNKKFLVSMTGRIRVMDHADVIYDGMNSSDAVRAYNSRD